MRNSDIGVLSYMYSLLHNYRKIVMMIVTFYREAGERGHTFTVIKATYPYTTDNPLISFLTLGAFHRNVFTGTFLPPY